MRSRTLNLNRVHRAGRIQGRQLVHRTRQRPVRAPQERLGAHTKHGDCRDEADARAGFKRHVVVARRLIDDSAKIRAARGRERVPREQDAYAETNRVLPRVRAYKADDGRDD